MNYVNIKRGTDILTDGQSDQILLVHELLFATKKSTLHGVIFPVERDTIIGKICISVVMLVTSFIGFIGVSYGEERVTLDEI